MQFNSTQLNSLGNSQDFHPIFPNQNCVFELCSHASIGRGNCPLIAPFKTITSTFHQHWFDRKHHAGKKLQFFVVTIVSDKGRAVKVRPDPVAPVLFDGAVSVGIGDVLNGSPYICQARSGTNSIDGLVQGLSSRMNQPPCRSNLLFIRFGSIFKEFSAEVRYTPPVGANFIRLLFVSNNDRCAIISVDSIDKTTHVEANNVTKFKRACIWDSVTDYFVYAGTKRFRETDVVEGRWVGARIQEGLMDDRIDFIRCNAGFGHRTCVIQDPPCQFCCVSHIRQVFVFRKYQNGVVVIRRVSRLGVGWWHDVAPTSDAFLR
mmetsp:Transcript_2079/g.4485  ORF Transcript_2079/g.4485 Transcript_2079/m.4485 type:complete len:318 (+) Transcript_2079:3426-4379(+)